MSAGYDLFGAIEMQYTRSLLDQLLADSRLYTQSNHYQELLDFVVRLRNFAPFNAMLLQVQKPGLRYAASARDWQVCFGRQPVDGARPLLILWPFGPVALVYDVVDTEGRDLPRDVFAFPAEGDMTAERLASFTSRVSRKNIECRSVDEGDKNAGRICVVKRASGGRAATRYRMHINRNHKPPVQFATLAHELGHLFLGHLGEDKKLNVPGRWDCHHDQREIEAESVAYVVCRRNGVAPASETYLANYIRDNMTVNDIDVYQVMRSAGQVEAVLGLSEHSKFEAPEGVASSCSGVQPRQSKPRLEAFVATLGEGEPYEFAIERFLDAMLDWHDGPGASSCSGVQPRRSKPRLEAFIAALGKDEPYELAIERFLDAMLDRHDGHSEAAEEKRARQESTCDTGPGC